jgi:hypothetical protein
VPKRTNLFQEVVAVIYEHLAGDAVKEESAYLINRLTGNEREVDVVLRYATAGTENVIAIEAASRSRRAAVDWVEQMIGKHKNLPTTKVVLVSEAGFTQQARKLAEAEYMDALTPEDAAGDDPAAGVINAIRSLWPKTVSLTPESARVWVERPGEGVKWFKAPADLDIFRGDGESVGTLVPIFHALWDANFPRVLDQIGLADIPEDTEQFFVLRVGPGWEVHVNGEPEPLFVRYHDGDAEPELQAIDAMEFKGKASITVSEITLAHKQLGEIDVKYAYGEGTVGGQPAIVVVTENEEGGMLTVRLKGSGADGA